ncbi:hypothetical protein JCM10450v2_002775 [Rhodotorula kratochvilovae]
MDGTHSPQLGFAPPAPPPALAAPAPGPPAPQPAIPPFGAVAPPPTLPAAAPPAPPAPAQPHGMLLPGQGGPKRTNVACSRCRRGKIKCVTVDGELPCQACIARGHDESCVRAEKGRAADDRAPRPRKRPADELDGTPTTAGAAAAPRRASYAAGGAGAGAYAVSPSPSEKGWSPQAVHAPLAAAAPPLAAGVKREEDDGVLPPLPLVVEGCESFFEGCFQLGFLHRPSFLHQLQTKPASVSPFLLLAMLSVSARFVSALVAKHGSPARASEVYAARAHDLVLVELADPSLERVQALYLLALHDYAHGCAFRAQVFHGVARQMAAALRLDEDLPAAGVIENEVRRRTWWFLTMDADLASAASGAFDPLTAPVALPSHEQDFTFGVESRVKQYFPGATSAAAAEHPTVPGELSLLGARLAIHSLFWHTARALADHSASSAEAEPWQPGSLLNTTQRALQSWLAVLSPLQKWSTSNLLAYRASHLDLAYWSIFADFHAVGILARRASLPRMIRALAPGEEEANTGDAPEGREYWAAMSEELVGHAFDLVELHEEVSGGRARGITPHLAFCIYLAGTTLAYLRLCPWPQHLATALALLQGLSATWPVAERWHRALYAQAVAVPAGAEHLALDAEQALFRPHAPAGEDAGPAGAAGKMDAASALAAMSGAALPASSASSSSWAGKPASAGTSAARYSSAVSGLLRAPLDPPAPGAQAQAFGGLFTPQPDADEPRKDADADAAREELVSVDLGDLDELSAYVDGYSARAGVA